MLIDQLALLPSRKRSMNVFLLQAWKIADRHSPLAHPMFSCLIETARQLMDKVDIPLPLDVVVAPGIDEGHRAQVKLAAEVTEQDMILDVGPKTAAGIAERIRQAATILWNGPLGVFEQEAFANGTQVLAEAIASSDAFSLAGGGDTLAAIDQFGVADAVSYISTGGGAFLEYVEGDFTKRLSFKIDFNEYEEDFSFRGLGKINLNNNTSDPSLLRESLSYALFREAGIPCSRVGYAMVSLTVPGLFDRQPHGLYTLVEQVDKRFLKDRYGSSKGLLMKPSTFGSFRYLGEDWAEYEIGFVPKTSATAAQKKHVIEFAKLIHKDGDQVFEERLETYLDVDQFLRFLAVNALLSNLDSFLGGTQNHYI